MMGCVDVVDDVPVVRNLARAGLEFGKTVSKAKSYPANVFEGIIKGAKNQDYTEVETPLDLAENLAKGTAGAVEGVVKTTVNTIKDIGYGTYDTLCKLFW
ncbi:MAG: hypothetical protein ACN23H_00325 [Candidatus Phytoplasma vitis]|nr:MAG: hypothetical protein M6G77_02600 [Candidatus Phytoplasma vitis]